MKKLVPLLISIFFINASTAQSYIEPLKKLNTFLETFEEKYYYGPFEVSEGGTLTIGNDHKSEYYNIQMKLITATVTEFKSVLIKGSDEHKWEINRWSGRSNYVNAIKFVSKNKNSLNTLLILINDFIRAYSQDFNLPTIALNLSVPNESNTIGKFTGSLKDEKKTGFGKFTLANGDVIEGNFENDVLNGKGNIIYQNGDVYKGEIKDNLASGQGETTFAAINNENPIHSGAYLDGKPNGMGKYFQNSYGNKITYNGNYKDGRYSGYGIWKEVSVSGSLGYREKRTKIYDGNWELGYYQGTGTLTLSDDSNTTNPAKITGEWLLGYVQNVKAYDEKGNLLFAGGKTEESAYYKKMSIERDEKNASEQAEREKNPTECVCPKCNGTGEIWAKQLSTWEIDNGTDKYGNKKTIKQTGYTNQFFSICPKCLGDGKCH